MDNKRAYRTLSLVYRLISFMKHLFPRILLAIAFAVGGFLTMIMIPAFFFVFLSKHLEMDFNVVDQWFQFPNFLGLIFLFILLAIARGLFRYGEHYFGHYVAFHSLAYLRKSIYAKLLSLAPAKLDGQKDGHLFKMIGEDVEALEIFFAHTLAPIGTAVIAASLIFVYFSFYNILLAFIALFTYALLAYVIPVFYAQKIEQSLAYQNLEKKQYHAFFLESLSAMEDLLQFQKAEERFKVLGEKSESIYLNEKHISEIQHIQMSRSFFVLGSALAIFSLYLFYLISYKFILLADALILFVVFSSSFSPFLELARLPLGFKKAMLAAQNFFELMDEFNLQKDGNIHLEVFGESSLNTVDFAYPGRNQSIFKQLSICFPKDKIIGICGKSGSGKSTLVKLLMRWYSVSSGEIYLNRQPLSDFTKTSLKTNMVYVPQHPTLFRQSLRENLTLGKPISDVDIWTMIEHCGLKDRLLALPEGLDTLVDETLFSSGEAQRLELIRALLTPSSCLILDEPTSHLDSLNEASFLSIVKQTYTGTVFIISHRASTLAFADCCYRFDEEKKNFVLEA